MANLSGFDAEKVAPAKDREPIPAGEYLAIIVESAMKPTKAGNGSYLELVYQLIGDGPQKNRKVWSRHNLENQNETAVQIAQSELSSICRAVGILKPSDSNDLHDKPFLIKVSCKKNKETGEMGNDVKGWKSKSAATNAPATTAAGGAPPWKRTG